MEWEWWKYVINQGLWLGTVICFEIARRNWCTRALRAERQRDWLARNCAFLGAIVTKQGYSVDDVKPEDSAEAWRDAARAATKEESDAKP